VRNGDDVADSCSVTGPGVDTRTWRGGKNVLKGTHKRAFENRKIVILMERARGWVYVHGQKPTSVLSRSRVGGSE
jgi:hypothetical protein